MAQDREIRPVSEARGSIEPGRLRRGAPPGPPLGFQGPVVSNARLGLMMFLAAEAMFFAGLVGAFLVFRLAASTWPPAFQPRLPSLVTGVNTVVLLTSGVTMRLALRAIRRDSSDGLMAWLGITAVLGAFFLLIQGYEWVRLIQFGLTMKSGVYGATFYTLIGCHGLHVLAAVTWLALVLARARKGRYRTRDFSGVQLCAMYWTFVVALWPVLYGLVYLY